jgi:hypothetical protein
MSRQLTAPAAKLSAHVIYFHKVPPGQVLTGQSQAVMLTRMGVCQTDVKIIYETAH